MAVHHCYSQALVFMLSNIESAKSDLAKLAGVLNQFKSEAVQVKLLELLVQSMPGELRAVDVPGKRRGRPPGKNGGVERAAKPAKAKKSATTGGKLGATGALNKLIESGYFKSRRSIAEVTIACKSKLGVEIAVTNLSGPLMRFVKEKKLLRAKNSDDRFVYWAK